MWQCWWCIFYIASHIVAQLFCWPEWEAFWRASCCLPHWPMKFQRTQEGSLHCIILIPLLTTISAVLHAIIYIHIPFSGERREWHPPSLVASFLTLWITPMTVVLQRTSCRSPPQLIVHTVVFIQGLVVVSPCLTQSQSMATHMWSPDSSIKLRIWGNGLGGYYQGLLSRRQCSKPSKDPKKNKWRTCGMGDTYAKFFSKVVSNSFQGP